MTSFSFTRYRKKDGDPFDPFGPTVAQTSIACPRGWKGMEDKPAEGYLATHVSTAYATPTSPAVYIHNRVASTTTFELQSTTGKTVSELAALIDTSAGLALIGHSRNFYDGPAFVGLPLGQVGKHGAITRSEALALTDDVLQQAYGVDVPPYLEPTGTPAWTADYPTEFRSLIARRAGYAFHAGSASPTDPAGYFVTTERRRYDVHTDPNGRGLVLETLDPLHDAARDPSAHRVVTGYDAFQFLPTTVTDAAGLTIDSSARLSRAAARGGDRREWQRHALHLLAARAAHLVVGAWQVARRRRSAPPKPAPRARAAGVREKPARGAPADLCPHNTARPPRHRRRRAAAGAQRDDHDGRVLGRLRTTSPDADAGRRRAVWGSALRRGRRSTAVGAKRRPRR